MLLALNLCLLAHRLLNLAASTFLSTLHQLARTHSHLPPQVYKALRNGAQPVAVKVLMVSSQQQGWCA